MKIFYGTSQFSSKISQAGMADVRVLEQYKHEYQLFNSLISWRQKVYSYRRQ